MKNYAIIQLQGKQYQISEGDEIQVDRLSNKVKDKFDLNEVLLLKTEKNINIGSPLVKGTTVNCQLIAENKAKKIRVAKYKAKSRYRKVKGHRQLQSTIKILKIKS